MWLSIRALSEKTLARESGPKFRIYEIPFELRYNPNWLLAESVVCQSEIPLLTAIRLRPQPFCKPDQEPCEEHQYEAVQVRNRSHGGPKNPIGNRAGTDH